MVVTPAAQDDDTTGVVMQLAGANGDEDVALVPDQVERDRIDAAAVHERAAVCDHRFENSRHAETRRNRRHFLTAAAGVLTAVGVTLAVAACFDVDRETVNMDPARVAAALSPKTKAILPVHLYGQMAPMDEIQRICQEKGAFLLEDGAQAIGAKQRQVGSEAGDWRMAGAAGDSAAFSFAFRGWSCWFLGRADEAREWAAAARKRAVEEGAAAFIAMARIIIGLALGAYAGWNEGKIGDRLIMGTMGVITADTASPKLTFDHR